MAYQNQSPRGAFHNTMLRTPHRASNRDGHSDISGDSPFGEVLNCMSNLGFGDSTDAGESNGTDTQPSTVSSRRSRFFGSNNMFGSLVDVPAEDNSSDDGSGGLAVVGSPRYGDTGRGQTMGMVAHAMGGGVPRVFNMPAQLSPTTTYSGGAVGETSPLARSGMDRNGLDKNNTNRTSRTSRSQVSPTNLYSEGAELPIRTRASTFEDSNEFPTHRNAEPFNPRDINTDRAPGRFYGRQGNFEDNTPTPRPYNPVRVSRGGHGYAHRSSTSNSWHSAEQKHQSDFTVIRNSMRRLFKNSDVAHWKLPDYIEHKKAMLASQKASLDRRIAFGEEVAAAALKTEPALTEYAKKLGQQMTSQLHFRGNKSLVLGEQTIWCVDWQNGKEEVAPWPSVAEMKWEGDDRAKTSVGRFPPLPREANAASLPWSQLQAVEQYPLDQVCRVPTMEDIYAPVEEIEDDVKYRYITRDLEDAIDAFLES